MKKRGIFVILLMILLIGVAEGQRVNNQNLFGENKIVDFIKLIIVAISITTTKNKNNIRIMKFITIMRYYNVCKKKFYDWLKS